MTKSKIAVVGAGLMGIGIATQYAMNGYTVVVYDVDTNRLHDVPVMANKNFDEMVEAGVISEEQRTAALGRLLASSTLTEIVDVSVVFEAVPEVLDLKKSVYTSIESAVSRSAIIASNTSGFPPEALCSGMLHPERFLIAHFWNPPYLLPLVEIVPSLLTLQYHIRSIEKQLKEIGLTTIVLKKPITGFIGNRVQFAILREVLHILRSGIASPAEIDMVVQYTLGRRYQFAGPLASADLGGLNTLAEISKHLMPELAKDESVIEVLMDHVKRNEVGARSGKGFYEWTPEHLESVKANKRKLLQSDRERQLRSKTTVGEG
jgi:3-hydroxybutyryl-CoA dehydrogenase